MDIKRLQTLSGLKESTQINEDFTDIDVVKFFQMLASGQMSDASFEYEDGGYAGTVKIEHGGKMYRVELSTQDSHPVYQLS